MNDLMDIKKIKNNRIIEKRFQRFEFRETKSIRMKLTEGVQHIPLAFDYCQYLNGLHISSSRI